MYIISGFHIPSYTRTEFSRIWCNNVKAELSSTLELNMTKTFSKKSRYVYYWWSAQWVKHYTLYKDSQILFSFHLRKLFLKTAFSLEKCTLKNENTVRNTNTLFNILWNIFSGLNVFIKNFYNIYIVVQSQWKSCGTPLI